MRLALPLQIFETKFHTSVRGDQFVLGDLLEDPEEAWSITRDTILTTAAENIPVKRAVRRPWLTTETMDINDQKKEARLKGNHDEWKRLKGVYKARSKVDLELFLREISR